MALETASYLSQLVATNPAHTDGLSQADSHARLIKAALLATFPNFTAAALTSTQAQLDAAVAAVASGATSLADAGAFFKTNTTDGITNPAAGEVDLKAAGVVSLKAKATGIEIPGTITPTGAYLGGTGQLMPVGATCVWWNNTLPTGYIWCNGVDASRTTYPTLFALFGTTYGVGDSSTTFGIPNLSETVPVGRSTMGGSAARGTGASYALTTLNAKVGEQTHTLVLSEAPSHTHTAVVTDNHTHAIHGETSIAAFATGTLLAQLGSLWSSARSVLFGTTDTKTGDITVANNSQGGDAAHNIMQASTVCNWIIRAA